MLILNIIYRLIHQQFMITSSLSYSRYWQPSYLQATSISLVAGTVASFITYPFEFVKTVIQFQGTAVGFRGHVWQFQGYNPFLVVRQVHSTGAGLSGVFAGFDAHLYGRLTYLAVRNTIYSIIYNKVKPVKPYNDLSYRQKSLIGSIAGAVGAVVSHPFTVVSIRQILDGQINKDFRRNYSPSVIEAIGQLRASGQTFQGLKINVLRHVAYNAAITGPYDYFKEGLYTRFGEFAFVNPLALLLASGITALATLPLDNIRTRWIQLHKEPERNRLNFKSIMQAFAKARATEQHPFSVYAGFYTVVPQIFIYASLTVGITNTFTESWKKKEGLLEWQI